MSVNFSTTLLFITIYIVSLIYIANNIVSGKSEIGEFVLISSVLFSLYNILNELTSFIFAQKNYIKVLKTYSEIIGIKDKKETEYQSDNKSLIFEDVKYKYKQAQDYALKKIAFKFNAAEKIAIVGENGSGKTTMISIILNLLENEYGTYKNNVGKPVAILQDFQIYQLTIKQYIELGRGGEEMPESEVIDILKKVQLFDVISKYKDGIYTRIGQLNDGIELSRGQQQRLALGRLLANKDAKIWILDEPTSYLDPIAEIDMYKYILELSGNKLVFFISHRLGFAKNADKIIVINNGEIVESGTHENLLKNTSGLYYKMYQTQKYGIHNKFNYNSIYRIFVIMCLLFHMSNFLDAVLFARFSYLEMKGLKRTRTVFAAVRRYIST